MGAPIGSTSAAVKNIVNNFAANISASVNVLWAIASFRPMALQITGVVTLAANSTALADANSNVVSILAAVPNNGGLAAVVQESYPFLFNGATWDRQRSADLPSTFLSNTGVKLAQPGIAATAVVSGPAGAIVQSNHTVSTGSVASLTAAFGNEPAQKNNSLVVVCSVGNGTAPTVTDNQGSVYKLVASQLGPASAFGVYVFYGIMAVTSTVVITVTNSGAAASIAMQAYEVAGLLAIAAQQPDQTATAVGTSATAASVALNPQYDNEISFSGVALGTAAQTITPAAGWINDSGQLNPVTPAGLFSMVSMSQFIPDYESVIPQATFTSEPWAIASASFRPISLGVADNNRICLDTPTGDAQTISTASTVNGVTQVNRHNSGAFITILTGTVTGTLPTLTLQLQWSPNNGVTWLNFGAPISGSTNLQSNGSAAFVVYPSLLTGLTLGTSGTGAAATLVAAPLPRLWRISYTVGGSASPTFPITSFVNYVL
jgi:hypothetical protein